MTHSELVEKLKKLNWKKADIEAKLRMPKNSLSRMMSDPEKMPMKWQIALENFIFKIEAGGKPVVEYPSPGVIQVNSETMAKELSEHPYCAPKLHPSVVDEMMDSLLMTNKVITHIDGGGNTRMATQEEWDAAKAKDESIGIYHTMYDEMQADKKRLEVFEKIESYCKEVGIEPEDLVIIHKLWKDGMEFKKNAFNNLSAEPPKSNYSINTRSTRVQELIDKKLGKK